MDVCVEVIQLLRRRPSLVRNICCAGGNTADCWGNNTLPSRSSYTFARCCLPGGAARRGEPPSKWCPADARVARACCREAVPGLCPSPEGARSCCEAWSPPAVLPFPLGCGTRLWREDAEANIGGRLPPGRLEPLRAGQLDRLARHFYATGEVLPSLDLIQGGLKGRERVASDMCPEAAVLSALLELEKNSLHVPVRGLRARLASLRRYWEAFLSAAPGANGTGARALDGPVAMAGTVAEGFRRLDAQLRALAATVRDRAAAGGFKAHLLITVCLPSDHAGRGDGQALSNLMWKVFQPGLLSRSTTLYLYDVCYGFFPPGSRAYDLRNELEVELSPGPPAADAPPLVAEDKLPDLLRPGDLARRFERVVVVPFDQEIGVGIVAATMRHVAAHYDALPDLLLCFHPDVTEHVHPDALKVVLGSVASGTWPASVPFLNLGHRHNGPVDASGRVGSEPLTYCRNAPPSTAARWRRARSPFSGGWALQRVFPRTPAGFWCQNLERNWELLFERPISLPEDDYGDYDFGQFAVTREAMQRRPVGFWQRAWRALCSRGNYQHLPGTRYLSPMVDFAHSKTMSDWRGYHSQANKQTNKQASKQTNERTTDRPNERTNENNNKRTARHAHISTKVTTR